MSKKQWLVLLMLFLLYLLVGASIFYHIESRLEVEKVRIARRERIDINSLLNKHYVSSGGHDQHEILDKLTKYCGKSVHNYTEGEVDSLKWDFYNSFYFAYTVVSTIGYGNLAPTNMFGRVLMIFYALIGIPINGILLAQLGEFFSETFVSAVRRYKAYKKNQNEYSKKSLSSLEKRRFSLAVQILGYLIPGFVMFIFFPAFLFSYYEGWTYDEAVYYAFVTLTTIGFGDYVAGQDNTKGSGIWFGMYKIFLIVWISFGLGYIVMIMTFIGRGMRSKKIARIEHKLALKLKHTQSKIWNEFNEDVNYLRRVFNELQFSKVKRVYVDEYDYDTPPPKFPRSNSFPNLRELVYGGLEVQMPPHPRRRANSEVVPTEEAHVARVVSETDLQRIDKNATFATHAMVQPAELLARLVNILGYIPPPPDDDEVSPDPGIGVGVAVGGGGVQGFSEKDILASETNAWNSGNELPRWKLGGDDIKPCRSRATSEVRLDRPELFLHPNEGEWTWSGPSTKIQEIMRARKSAPSDPKETATTGGAGTNKTRFLSRAGLALPKSVLPRWVRQFNSKKPGPVEQSLSVNEAEDAQDRAYGSQPQTPGGFSARHTITGGLERRASYAGTHLTHTGGSSLLEETSVADFLRALTALHSRVGAVPDDLTIAAASQRKIGPQPGPQRKLGTASLTPPKLPSLLTLFSPPMGHSQSQQNTVTAAAGAPVARRFSLRTAENSSASTPMYQRRATQLAQVMPRPRRFSLRPVTTPLGTMPQYSYSSNASPSSDQSPPPYSTDPFVLDNAKKPLVKLEGAPGVSSPVAVPVSTVSSTGRRFSLRPAQIGVPPAPSSSSSATKAIPRWRAGFLQRQIGHQNVQRKVQRAFSLSDVHSDERERNIGISPLALHDNARTITSLQGQRLTSPSGQKTVTIVSPEFSRTKLDQQQLQRASDGSSSSSNGTGQQRTDNSSPFYRRYNSDIESLSSKSSSRSSKSLHRSSEASSSTSADSRKSSLGEPAGRETAWTDEWDFPPTAAAGGPSDDEQTAALPNEQLLEALVSQSEATTRKLSAASGRRTSRSSREDESLASAAAQPSIAPIEPWDQARRRGSSSLRSRTCSCVAAPDRTSVDADLVLREVRVQEVKPDDVRIDLGEEEVRADRDQIGRFSVGK